MKHTLIANSGIQMFTFRLKINTQDRFKEWFHEWYETSTGEWKLELVTEVRTDDSCVYYKKAELIKGGYLAPSNQIDVDELRHDGIKPLMIDDEVCDGVKGEIYGLTFTDKYNKLQLLENQWLPIPYFFKRTERKFKFGPLNWSRFKIIPIEDAKGSKTYNVVLAFDTHTTYGYDAHNENPAFPDGFSNSINLALCLNELFLLDFCSTGKEWSFVEERLLQLVHPEISRISQL